MRGEAALAAVGPSGAALQQRFGDQKAEGLEEIRKCVERGDFAEGLLQTGKCGAPE